MDSPHTTDLSPQTHFQINFVIKGGFLDVLLFWITITQQVFDKAEKGIPETISFIGIWVKALSDVQPSFFLPSMQHSYSNLSVVLFILATRG